MSDDFTVSDAMWDGLEVVVARADGQAPTHVVHHRPKGDAAIMSTTAEALAARGFVAITNTTCWPTDGGRLALSTHRRTGR